jgi:hypothetical protein
MSRLSLRYRRSRRTVKEDRPVPLSVSYVYSTNDVTDLSFRNML